MNEKLGNNSEFDNDAENIDQESAELAASGLSRVIDENSDYDREPENDGYDEDSYEDGHEDDDDEDNYEDDDDEDSYEDDDDEDSYEDDNYEEDEDDEYYYDDGEWHSGERRSEFDEDNMKLIEIELPQQIKEQYVFLDELPSGIAVMGGVARSIAREIITGDIEPIRDIDLVNIVDEEGNSKVDDEMLDKLSREYMPDDYAFGHGIGNDTFDNYFKTRDFTVNQCLVIDGKVVVSDYAYNDFKENIIRPTYYEQPFDGDETSSRLFLKSLMMCSVLSQISDSVPLIEDVLNPYSIRKFDIALYLNKAMSRGAKTARIFTENLVDWGYLSEEYSRRPVALAKYLEGCVYNFDFRPSTDARFEEVDECRDMSGYFIPNSMQEYYPTDKHVRQAMSEYEDSGEMSDDWDFEIIGDERERLRGHYTQAEYDEVNRCANRNNGGWYYD